MIKPFLSDPVHSKYINKAVLDKYWAVGGIRQVYYLRFKIYILIVKCIVLRTMF